MRAGSSREVAGSESVVANGKLAGLTITELLKKYKDKLIGAENNKRFGNEFPLLIKFIDAKDNLSIQVHPNDSLAAEVEMRLLMRSTTILAL